MVRCVLILALLVAGCGKDADETGDPPDIITLDLSGAPEASSLNGRLDSTLATRVDATQSVFSAVSLVLSDTRSQDLLDIHAGPQPIADECWETVYNSVSVDIDYAGCSLFDIDGNAKVTDTAFGPLVVQVRPGFELAGREMYGNMSLERTGPEEFQWYTDATTLDGSQSGDPFQVSVSTSDIWQVRPAGALAASLGSGIRVWGEVEVQAPNEDTPELLTFGDLAAADGAVVPADAAGFDFFPRECRCQTSGTLTAQTTLSVQSFFIDIDTLKVEDDGVDDPEIEILTPLELPGLLTLAPGSSCGTWLASFAPDQAIDLTVDSLAIANAIQSGCNTNRIPDDRCAILSASTTSAGGVLSVPQAVLDEAATDAYAFISNAAFCNP